MLKIADILNKNRRILLFIGVLIGFLLIIFIINFTRKDYKNINIGNNISNKTLDDVEEYILNISSYKAKLEVTINSNKNTNKYILTQVHNKDEDVQEIISPENIKGMKLLYKDNTLTIKNTMLDLQKVYNNYPYIESNNLWLNSFIEEYKISKNKKIFNEDENIIILIEVSMDSKIKYKELYLDPKTLNPTKLLIQDNDKNEIIYILYNEIELNY